MARRPVIAGTPHAPSVHVRLAQAPQRIQVWTAEHRSDGLDLLRMYLGFALFVRGLLLLRDPHPLQAYVADLEGMAFIVHYVVLAHIAGGLALGLGMFTRLAAAVQLPALIGAVFVVHFREGLMATGQSLELAAFVLFALVVFTFFGSGRLSLDEHVFRERRSGGRARRELFANPVAEHFEADAAGPENRVVKPA